MSTLGEIIKDYGGGRRLKSAVFQDSSSAAELTKTSPVS